MATNKAPIDRKKKRLLSSLDAAFSLKDNKPTKKINCQSKIKNSSLARLKDNSRIKTHKGRLAGDGARNNILETSLAKDILNTSFNELLKDVFQHGKSRMDSLYEYIKKAVIYSGSSIELIIKKQLMNKSLQLLNPVEKFDLDKSTKKKKKASQSGEKLGYRKKDKLQMFAIPKETTYESMNCLNNSWDSYMRRLIGHKENLHTNKILTILHNADYHGCLLTVKESKCKTFLGKSGIVIQETCNTFRIIMSTNRCIVLPKKGNLFSFYLDSIEFIIDGNKFENRKGKDNEVQLKKT